MAKDNFIKNSASIRISVESGFRFYDDGVIGSLKTTFYSTSVDYEWEIKFFENQLSDTELINGIKEVIAAKLYYKINKIDRFWYEQTAREDWRLMPILFQRLTEFFKWLSEANVSYRYTQNSRDYNDVKKFICKGNDSDLIESTFLRWLRYSNFFCEFNNLIDYFNRSSSWHQREMKKRNLVFKAKVQQNTLIVRNLLKETENPMSLLEIKKQELENQQKQISNREKDLLHKENKINNLKEENNKKSLELKSKEIQLNDALNSIDREIEIRANEIVDKILPKTVEEIRKQQEKKLFERIFNPSNEGTLSPSDIFEKEEAERERRKRLEEVERREFKSEIRDEIREVKSEFQSYTSTHSVEHARDKAEQILNFERLNSKIENVKVELDVRFVKFESEAEKRQAHLEAGMQVLKSYVDGISINIHARIDKEVVLVGKNISELKVNVERSFLNVEKEFSIRDTRFKEEILQINENQRKMVAYLETLQNQTEHFKNQIRNEIEKTRIELDRKGITFEQVKSLASHLLEKSELLYRRVQTDNALLSGKMELSLKDLELSKNSMFVELAKQKLVLEKATQDVYHTAKEVAYGKMDIELLHAEKQQRLQDSQMQLNSTVQEIQMKERELKSFWANESTRTRLENENSFLRERHVVELAATQRQLEEAQFVARRLRDKNLAY